MILIIDNYDSFTYNLYQSVAQIHADVRVVRNDKITIDEVKTLNPEAIILSPGPGRPENAGICIELVQQLGQTTPILGVCLGHQAITMAYGGKVVKAPEIVHGKKDMIFHHRKGLYAAMPLPFEVGRYHSLIAERESLPDTLLIEAENAQGIIMGVRHQEYPVYGIQFHPESILTPIGDEMLGSFVKLSS
jgi:anthranilate synthase component 2